MRSEMRNSAFEGSERCSRSAASPCLVLSLGTEARSVPDHLTALDGPPSWSQQGLNTRNGFSGPCCHLIFYVLEVFPAWLCLKIQVQDQDSRPGLWSLALNHRFVRCPWSEFVLGTRWCNNVSLCVIFLLFANGSMLNRRGTRMEPWGTPHRCVIS